MSNTQSVNNQTNPTGNSSGSQGIQSIFDMEAIITAMMQEYMEENSSSSQMQGNMGGLVEKSLENTYDKISEELKKEEESKPKHWYDKLADFFKGAGEILGHLIAAAADATVGNMSGAKAQWKDVETNPELANLIKALTYVVAAITIVAGCITGNFELVAVTAVLLAVTQSGLLNKIEDHIGSAGGKFAFDLLVIAIATVATAGTGALETTMETVGEEEGTELSNLACKEGEEASEQATQKVTQLNIGKGISSGFMGLGASLGSVNLAQDSVNLFDSNKKDKQHIEEILQIVFDVTAAVSAVGGGLGSIASASSDATGLLSEKVSQLLTKFVPQEVMENASTFVESNMKTLTTLLLAGELAGNGTAAVLGGANATNQFRIAGIQKEVGELQGALEKLTNALQENTDNIKNTDQSFQNNLQGFSQMIGNFDHYFDGYAAQAQELLS